MKLSKRTNYKSMLDLIGNTPVVQLTNTIVKTQVKIFAKLEGQNPTGSVKDRIALQMIEDAEQNKSISPGSTILEPTSGNTGISLAFVAKMKGYKVTVVMPDNVSEERTQLLKAYGAEIIYIDSTQYMSILEDAYVINQNKELFGENIFIQFQDSSINEIIIDEDPIIYNKVTAKFSESATEDSLFDVILGESMIIKYNDNKLEQIKVIGMASSLYHVIDDMLLEGTNEASGDTILFSFIDEELTRIMVQGGGRGFFTPESGNSNIDSIIYYRAQQIDYDILNNF